MHIGFSPRSETEDAFPSLPAVPRGVYPLGACVRASWVLLDRGARVRSCLTGLPIIALDGFVDPAFSNRALARLPVGLGLGFMDVILE